MADTVTGEYYQRRELHALAMSQAAINPSIQAIHLEMARRYADLARGIVEVRRGIGE